MFTWKVEPMLMLVIWLSVFLSVSTSEPNVSPPPDLEVSVDDLINAGMTARGIPGVSLAVVHNGTVVLSKGYGVKDVTSRDPVDANTVFGLASLTKAFTDVVLAKLLRNNSAYDLSTTVQTILGQDVAKFNNTQLTNYATLQDLMTHSMGIPRNNFIRLDTELTRDNIMRRLQFLPATDEYRRSFLYSDLMYGLLTHIVEVLGGPGKSWEDLVTSEIFQPLGMANSTFLTRVNFSRPDVATPYTINKSKQPTKLDYEFLRVYASTGGSGAVMSTANDMAKYLQFLVSGGKNQEGQQVVEASYLQTAFTPVAALGTTAKEPILKPATPATMSTDAYGLAWRLGYYRGYKMIQHTGSTYGYVSLITILPHSGSAIFTAINGVDNSYYFRFSLHCAILDLLLHKAPWINSTTIATFPAPWYGSTRRKRNALPVTNKESTDDNAVKRLAEEEEINRNRKKRANAEVLDTPLTNFTGSYVHGAYGRANISLNSSGDKLRMTYGIGVWELNYAGSGLEFNTAWLRPPPVYTIRLKFLANENVYGFECLNCDPVYVPAFYRH